MVCLLAGAPDGGIAVGLSRTTTGHLSALAMNVAAMLIFMTAGFAGALVVARAVQGFATGFARRPLARRSWTPTAIVRRAEQRDRLRGIVGRDAVSGRSRDLRSGARTARLYRPAGPLGDRGGVLWFMPETAALKPGPLASLRPRVRVPLAARDTFISITPVNIAAWALGGFYFSLMPAVVCVATARHSRSSEASS